MFTITKSPLVGNINMARHTNPNLCPGGGGVGLDIDRCITNYV